ncbi:MAG: protease inhibitor I42 family protein [Leptolyngbyaceae cyanobacterium CRU_2_3]|nr:protease inhibitor I42 family protein [Leptolyngbyaceae cyanobacterium CRU_2_3]
MSVVFLTQADSGRTIQVNSGDIFSVRLTENPTTGYRWTIQSMNDEILELQNSEYAAPANIGIGSGSQRIFTFRAHAAGTADLQLKEWRGWEGDRSITHQFNLTVQVRSLCAR